MAEGPEQRAHRRVGTIVRDKYRIDAFIATGSVANVYAATHRNGSRVALKILHKELARDPTMSERFRRQGYFANAIGHTGVVRAIDDDVAEDGSTFIVLELLEGESLEDRRQRMGGRMTLPEVLKIADAMLDVLGSAHAHEILHRDLKPENIYITRKNEVKVLDFGIARFNDGRSSSEMTEAGMVLGTPAFMPPEQALGRREEVDARSDIWAVGATLFMVLTGQSVHIGGDAKTKLIATARTPARPLHQVLPETPRAVASVIDRALAFDKSQRWADAGAMREALRWARMSLDPTPLDRGRDDSIEPVPTRRSEDDDMPTLTGHSPLESFGDDEPSTERRHKPIGAPLVRSDIPPPHPPGGMPGRRSGTVPPMPPDPRMSWRPPSSPPSAGSFEPITKRVPSRPDDSAPNRTDASPNEADPLPPQASRPRDSREPGPRPRPAAGVPPDPNHPSAAALRTTLGMGPMVSGPVEIDVGRAGATAQMPSVHPAASFPPVPLEPRPALASVPPMQIAKTAPAMMETSRGAPLARPSLTPESPGPLLATIAPRRLSRVLRVLVPVAIGILTGVGTYTLVVYQRAANASHSVGVESPPTSSAVPTSPSASPGPRPIASSAVPVVSSTPPPAPASTRGSESVATAPAPAPPRRRPRPKPKPVPAAVTPPPETAPVEPTPPPSTAAPTPAPAPTPQDSLPRKEDN